MRTLAGLSLLLIVASCGDASGPTPLSDREILGSWVFHPVVAGPLPQPITLVFTSLTATRDPRVLDVASSWGVGTRVPLPSESGTLDRRSGRFHVRMTSVPGQTIDGALRADGTATATYAAAVCCTGEVAGVHTTSP